MHEASLLDLFAAREGVVAFVGAGGKKTTLYRLAALHPGRVAITTTVRMAPFPADFAGERLIGEVAELEKRLPEAAHRNRKVAYALPPGRPGRLTGAPPERIAALHAKGGFDATYVKADGARMRWVKCPGAGEPVWPEGVTTVVPIVSARAFDRVLDDRVAHRPERCAALLGAAQGTAFRPQHLAPVFGPYLALPADGPPPQAVPLINMVDGPAQQDPARAAAEALLAAYPRVARVVLARMDAADPLVDVVTR